MSSARQTNSESSAPLRNRVRNTFELELCLSDFIRTVFPGSGGNKDKGAEGAKENF